ncbi:MAG: TldD/PmbA family protein [Bacillota bacterium]
MTDPRQSAKYGLEALLKAGADKAQCSLTLTDKHEMNVDSGEISLLRTTFDTRVALTAIKDNRKGQSIANRRDVDSLDKAASDVLGIASAAQPDEAHDIAESQPSAEFSSGSESPDLDRMHFRLNELLREVKSRFPKAVVQQAILDFTRTRTWFLNSNGVDFVSSTGVYHAITMFSSREGDKTSSFNYVALSLKDLDRDLLSCGSLAELLRQSGEQIETRPLEGKFVGDVIYTPECLGDLLQFLFYSLSDGPMISGTSIYKESLGRQVASPLLSIHGQPASDDLAEKWFVTRDGYAAKDATFVDKGVLKSHLLSLYGSRKTGKARALNEGNGTVVDPGNTSFSDMVKGIKRGLLMARFSGGRPSNTGDFAGVAKNSYLIEDGEIKYPVSETMVSGNFAEMLRNVKAVSRERVNFGYDVSPWVAVSGVTISGK